MSKEELKEYVHIQREITYLRNRLRVIEEENTVPIKTDCQDEITSLLKEQLQSHLLSARKIESYIANVSDSQIRLILMLRYIKGYSWLKVAFAIGKYDEQYPRKKIAKFLNNT